jgi:hypothetical protein
VKTASGLAIALLAFFAWTASSESGDNDSDVVLSRRYTTRITAEHRQRSPAWDDGAENPPLSAKQAKALATQMKDSVVKDSDTHWWGLHGLTLRPMDGKWIWVVTFREHTRNGISTGPATELDIVVMMDGTALEPKRAA